MIIKVEFDGHNITLYKDGKPVFKGYKLITPSDFNKKPYSNYKMHMPDNAVAAIGASNKTQWISADTLNKAEKAINNYNDQPSVRLPRERNALRSLIQDLYSKWDYAREQDFNNDIGLHSSSDVDKEIQQAEKNLVEFDKIHPEIKAEFDKEQEEKTARNIQSALNS